MKNIDNELIKWASDKINKEYKDDVALLIGQKGACKIPTDKRNTAFDFFVPETERGYDLAESFIIEDIGYNLFPMSWDRLENIAGLNEKITFALADGVVLYARTREDEKRFLKIQNKLKENLKNKKLTYEKLLGQINNAMDIFKTMIFDDDMNNVRKSAGEIVKNLSIAIAAFNGKFLGKDYGRMQIATEVSKLKLKPHRYIDICYDIVECDNADEIKKLLYEIIYTARNFYMENNHVQDEEYALTYAGESTMIYDDESADNNVNQWAEDYSDEYNKIKADGEKVCYYDELASWYYEARYTFRKIEYYCRMDDYMSAYELGCYIQQKFDCIQNKFGLEKMALLEEYKYDDLTAFAERAKEIERYILSIVKVKCTRLDIFSNLEEFIGRHG